MEDVSEGGITTPIGSVSFKGKRIAEFIAILSLALLFLLSYIMWEHKKDAEGMKSTFSDGFKEMALAMREQNQISREQVCLLSLSQERREREFTNENSLCKRLSRER